MNQKIVTVRGPRKAIDAWLERLEKNDLKQGKGSLQHPESKGYCCLGVLEVVVDGEVEKNGTTPSPEWLLKNGITFYHVSKDGGGIRSNSGNVTSPSVYVENLSNQYVTIFSGYISVWQLNDSYEWTFPQIAAALRNHVEYTDESVKDTTDAP